MAKLCVVTKPCFFKNKRYRGGEKVSYEGEKLPSYLEEIKGAEAPVDEAKSTKTPAGKAAK